MKRICLQNVLKKIGLFGLLVLAPFLLQAQTPLVILKKMDAQAASIKDKTAQVVMQMIDNRTGKVKTRKAVLMQKLPYKTLFRFTYPPSQAGIGTLSLPGGIVYLYMPAFGKPKKISSIANGGAFSQSDFSTEDMGPKNWAENYHATLLSTNDTAYVLQLIPQKAGPKYARLVVTVNKKHFFPQRVVYYNQQGQIAREADYKYVKIGNLWTVAVASMTNFSKAHTTRIINSDIRLNRGLKDSLFTPEQLMRADGKNKK